ncbi:TPA: hypothetical protein RG395_000007 [Legionella pneumophila]|nr:hypothetical protein [Legionella pneumophila]MDW8880607.1 hypothetical protein [Legionella pneumophila subsp. fraseri]MDW8962223.1 hypothetical protein [Legionella pneumophila subsp. fraseri]MDW9034783.1 hypothetical protein [Legionella pneumophila subsp. fraseri]MDW9037541.1 hypothetical protein [Legionella pneumophila subsp. fraseri]MDW9040904.1 hypothetical protein [Legionella pneumophila subsp. fraseri]
MHHLRTLIISGLTYFFINSCVYAQLPDNYQSLSAQQKQDLLWDEITHSHEIQPLPPLTGNSFNEVLEKLKGLFNLSPTFDHAGDELPEGRVKIIHANGSVGKIAFIPAPNHPFTGIYQKGGIGLARLSLATSPADDNYIPGMAIKFLISQHDSLNLQVMNLLEGQKENWNYFAKDFSNKIPHPTSWTLKAIEKIFEWTRSPANDLPLWHLAAWTSEGRFEGIPIYPERLFFRPSSSIKDIIPEDSREDFRTSLLQIPMGSLYEVYGEYRGSEYHVGTLILESTLLASNYGDKNLFFRHQR